MPLCPDRGGAGPTLHVHWRFAEMSGFAGLYAIYDPASVEGDCKLLYCQMFWRANGYR